MPWSEDGIELDYSKKFHTTLLVPLRDFIQNGINFTVIKTKHMYVLEDPNAAQNIESKPPASAKSSKSLLIIVTNVFTGSINSVMCKMRTHYVANQEN